MFGLGHEKCRKFHVLVMRQVRLCASRDFIEEQDTHMLQIGRGCCRWHEKAGGWLRWLNEEPIKRLFPVMAEG